MAKENQANIHELLQSQSLDISYVNMDSQIIGWLFKKYYHSQLSGNFLAFGSVNARGREALKPEEMWQLIFMDLLLLSKFPMHTYRNAFESTNSCRHTPRAWYRSCSNYWT